MSFREYTPAQEIQQRAFCRASVLQVHGDGRVSVRCPCRSEASLCRIVTVSEGSTLRLAPDDIVVILHGVDIDGADLIVGRIGESLALAARAPEPDVAPPPDTLVIEAKQSLVLRVGDGSITIREDGRILIKGKDLVSHAQRLNRIKGGAVSIN